MGRAFELNSSFAVKLRRLLACGLLAVFTSGVTLADSGPAINHKLVQVNAAGNPVPICLGVSGWNDDLGKRLKNGSCGVGTLGSLLKDLNDGSMYILSNWHVFVEGEKKIWGKVGDSITHVGCGDTASFEDKDAIPTNIKVPPPPKNPPPYKPPFQVGALSDWIQPVPRGRVDAAIAAVHGGFATSAILDIAPFDTKVQRPMLGSVVIKSGRTTGRSYGYVSAVNVKFTVHYAPPVNKITFVKQIQISPLLPADRASAAGDSGSLVLQVKQRTNGPVIGPVGLLYAGASKKLKNKSFQDQTYANRMYDVINAFKNGGGGDKKPRNLAFVPPANCSNKFPFPISSGREMEGIPASPGPIPDPEVVEAVSQLEDRYSDQLSQIPGVIGHAVSLSETGSGEVVITLFVSEITPEIEQAAPSELEGVPVELEVLVDIHLL
ncbi:MAG: hypothetical protein ABSD98_11560 [Candidatus Korobacteraceae bacterium]|jgi:hypothetical protein